jgi:hypothetical protein
VSRVEFVGFVGREADVKVKLSDLTVNDIREQRPDLLDEIYGEQEQRAAELVAEVQRLTAEQRERREAHAAALRERDRFLMELQLKADLYLRRITFPSIITHYVGIPESTKRSAFFCESVGRCKDEQDLYAFLAAVKLSFHSALNIVVSEEKKYAFGNGAVSENEREQLRKALVEE